MKRISVLFSIVALVITFNSCDQKEYPYDLSAVKKGCLINVSTVLGSDLSVPFAPLSGETFNLRVMLQVVEQGAGPFTSVDLMLVHNDSESFIYQTNITSLPDTIDIDYYQALNLIGGENVWIGDKITFTANVHLPDGTIIYGWSALTGYNNVAFAEYKVNGGSFASRTSWFTKTCFYSNVDWLTQWWAGPATSHYFRESNPEIDGNVPNSSIEVLPADDVPTAEQWVQMNVEPAEYSTFDLAGFKVTKFFLDERVGAQTGTESSIKIWVNTAATTPKVYIPIQPIGLVFDRNQFPPVSTTPNYQEVIMSAKANYPPELVNGIDIKRGVIKWVANMKIGTGTGSYNFNKVEFHIQDQRFVRD